jgi:hypothetical protein
MKTQLIVLVLVVLLFSMSNAQEKADTLKIFKTNSLQFRVYDFISLSSFKGALISYKYHCSEKNAWRFGISLRGNSGSQNDERNNYYADSTLLDQKRSLNHWNIQLIAQYLNYLNVKDEIKLFYGIGPFLGLSINNYNTDKVNTFGTTVVYEKKRINENYQIGITGSLGIEWFFRKNMSLHAEYGFNAYYYIDNDEYQRIYDYSTDPDRLEERKVESNGWGIDDTSALLGLSVYF